VLEPGMSIKEAVLAFDRAEAEALAVVNSHTERRVIGLLTERGLVRIVTREDTGGRPESRYFAL